MKIGVESDSGSSGERQVLALGPAQVSVGSVGWGDEFNGSDPAAMVCPNCGLRLEGRKCKLFCLRSGCGYQVTCAEW